MKMKKLSVALTVAILIGLMPVLPVLADDVPTVRTMSPTSVKPGDTVTIQVLLENNPGIACMQLEIGYDATALRIESPDHVTRAAALGSLMFVGVSSTTYRNNPFKVGWAGANNDRTNGAILNIQFNILPDAKGGASPITVAYVPANTSDQDRKPIILSVVNGSLNIVRDDTSVTHNDPGGGNPPLSGGENLPTSGDGNTDISDSNVPLTNSDMLILPFTDVESTDWFYEAVRFVAENGLMNGTSVDKFSPNTAMSRAMLVTVLYRLEGELPVSGSIPFADVKAGEWYSDAILWANNNNIVIGYSSVIFGRNDPITREQTVTILYRYAKLKGLDVSASVDLSGYTDMKDISGWALDAMKWAVAERIVQGRTNTTIVPQGTSTRAEVAMILQRYSSTVLLC